MEQQPFSRVEHGFAILTFIATIIAGFILSVASFRDYGNTIFTVTPIMAGCLATLVFRRVNPKGELVKALLSILYGCLICCVPLVLAGAEGFICLAMAAPIGMVFGFFGWVIAWIIQAMLGRITRVMALPLFLILPAASIVEDRVGVRIFDDEVVTEIRIEAPPSAIWPLLSNLELPPPSEPLFRVGVAHPTRIETRGLDRTCVLSTGRMEERIVVFEPEKRLSFQVLNTPPSMKELSPYNLHPAHLDDYFQCRTGEFELRPLKEGATLLIGRSTYRCRYSPEIYWKLWTRRIVRDIHLRVMSEVKRQAEQRK